MRVAVLEFLGKAITAVQEQATIMPVAAVAVQMLLGRTPVAPVAELAETEKHLQYLVAHMLAAGVEVAYQRGLLEVLAAAAMVRRETIPFRDQVLRILAAARAALHLNVVALFLLFRAVQA